MKRFKCHKVVEAAQIRAAEFAQDGSGKVAIRDDGDNTHTVIVPAGFVRPGAVPQEGDYLVRYLPDGYLSWSPKDKFEDGYSPEPAPTPAPRGDIGHAEA
jgi:hypothetical protein